MIRSVSLFLSFILGVFLLCSISAIGQQNDPDKKEPKDKKEFEKKDFDKKGFPDFGKGDFFKKGPFAQKVKLLAKFDKNNDGWLNNAERQAAREYLKTEAKEGGGFGFGKKGGFGKGPNREPPTAGPKVKPVEVKTYPNAKLYDPTILRTFFIEFEGTDWEAELAEFRNTDVEIVANLTVDGKLYKNVGVHFRGASSYFAVGTGHRRSLGISMNLADEDQKLYGYRSLNLLNSHDDPTYMHTTLYSHIARTYLPAPKANHVKVIINGESWGIYVNAQQFNKDFLKENYPTGKGDRWKVKGSPGGGGGLDYIGDKIEDYKRRYELKTEENEAAWKALMHLCRTLSKTPPDQLEEALKPILDIDNVLWYLAVDIAVQNADGYWIRASDYSLYRDKKGVFRLIPHDMNEAFGPAFGPGMGKGGGGGPASVDPLVGLEDERKPLRSKLLSIPKFREQYLRNLKTIAEKSLDWQTLGPIVAKQRELIEKEVELDTRKLYTLAAFQRTTADKADKIDAGAVPPGPGGPPPGPGGPPGFGGGGGYSLRLFADQRREFLLNHAEIKKLDRK